MVHRMQFQSLERTPHADTTSTCAMGRNDQRRQGHGQLRKRRIQRTVLFASRFEEGTGTNPEELLAAAHASCFAMALSLILGSAGFKPDYVDATAHVTVTPQDGGFKITKSHIVCEAKVPGWIKQPLWGMPRQPRRTARYRKLSLARRSR